MLRHRWFLPLLFGMIIACCPSRTQADVTLTGEFTTYFSQFTERIDSFQVMYNGRLIDTGPVTASLDLTHPDQQLNHYNFDKMTQDISVDLLVTAPILAHLGLPPMHLHLHESGPITEITSGLVPDALQTVCLDASLDSKGVLEPGGFLGGMAYAGRDKDKCVDCCPKWRIASNGPNDPGHGHVIGMESSTTSNIMGVIDPDFTTLTDLDGHVIHLSGTVEALYNMNPVPEPSSMTVVAGSLLGLGGLWLRRWGRSGRSFDR
jgi:hypothetical protein